MHWSRDSIGAALAGTLQAAGSRRSRGAIPRIDDVSAGEDGEPCQQSHGPKVDAEEGFISRGDRRPALPVAAPKFHHRTRTGQQIERAEPHSVD